MKIGDALNKHRERYGSVRITQELCRRGIHVNHKSVSVDSFMSFVSMLKEVEYYKYYNCRPSSLTRPNLINQCFQIKGKNEIWYC
ncbi:IS3 family transposase [Streptococcus canis]|uniref:IS3 family transposase n=1 Tax=Streptococcus canis TaxID=1329 RepID=UPI0013D96AF2